LQTLFKNSLQVLTLPSTIVFYEIYSAGHHKSGREDHPKQ